MKSMIMMKKLVLAAVVVAVVVARAGDLYWSASGIESSSANELTGTKQYLAYLFVSDVFPLNAGMYKQSTIASVDTVLNLLKSSDAKTAESVTTLQSYAKVLDNAYSDFKPNPGYLNNGYSSEAGTAGFSDLQFGYIGVDSAKKYADVSIFAIVFDAANYADAKNYMVLTDSEGNTIKTERNTTAYNSDSKTIFDFGSQANNTWHAIGTVPEPTSGLLILVGVASLALRRKRVA